MGKGTGETIINRTSESAVSRKASTLACLQKVDEVEEHQPVELRQRLNHGNGCNGVVAVADTLLVEIHGDERLLQLSIPQLDERG